MAYDIPVQYGLAIIAVALFIVWKFYRRKVSLIEEMPDIPDSISGQGHEVPVLATFTGLKSLPRHVSYSYNNLYPALTLYENSIECRVLVKKVIFLSEIEKADVMETFLTRNINIYVKNQDNLFTANLYGRRNLAQVLGYLEKRGVPLSERAKAFKAKNAL